MKYVPIITDSEIAINVADFKKSTEPINNQPSAKVNFDPFLFPSNASRIFDQFAHIM